jgi:hypothetical protein
MYDVEKWHWGRMMTLLKSNLGPCPCSATNNIDVHVPEDTTADVHWAKSFDGVRLVNGITETLEAFISTGSSLGKRRH